MPSCSRPAPALALCRAVPVTALMTVFLAASALVTGCGAANGASLATSTVTSTADTPVPPVTATPSPSAAAQPAAATQPAPTHRPASGLPWPAATTAGAADLQKAVDGGSQPWLLDPSEVAESYAAFHGWKDVQVSGGGDTTPTHVTVRSSAGTHTLTLAQPDRKGQGGIWLISDDSTG